MALSIKKDFDNGTSASYWKIDRVELKSKLEMDRINFIDEDPERSQQALIEYQNNKLNFDINVSMQGYVSKAIRDANKSSITSMSYTFKNVNILANGITKEESFYAYLYKQIKLKDEFVASTDC